MRQRVLLFSDGPCVGVDEQLMLADLVLLALHQRVNKVAADGAHGLRENRATKVNGRENMLKQRSGNCNVHAGLLSSCFGTMAVLPVLMLYVAV